MTAQEFFQTIAAIPSLLFIVTSMLAVGMGLTIQTRYEPVSIDSVIVPNSGPDNHD
jgi:hypothetical protein